MTVERGWPPALEYEASGLTLEKTLKMIEAAKAKAGKINLAVTIAVCDAGGNLIALERMDHSALLSIEIAINKAHTSVFGMIPTHQWGSFFKGPSEKIAPLWFHTDWITFMGGFPVIINQRIIGGLGVSGGTWEDGIVARAGLEAIGADLSGVDLSLQDMGIPREKW